MIELPADGVLAVAAALPAGISAWLLTRTSSPDRPALAVRVYLLIFRTSDVPKLQDYARSRSQFPRREAFLATWFVLFFCLFLIGLWLWPAARRP